MSGARRVRSGKTTSLYVRVTNASGTPCIIDFGATNLEVRVFSGVDRIWSSNDCPAWKPSGKALLAPAKPWLFAPTWATKRSTPSSCTLRTDKLKPGTYVANAELKGGTVAQWVLQLVA